MRKLKNIFNLLPAVMAAVGLLVSVSGCQPDGLVDDTKFSLYYQGITDIGPSTTMTLTPTYHGQKPSDFKITLITVDDGFFESDAFSVNPETGVFSMTGTENLPTGFYKISISCVSGSKTYEFADAITINMMKAVPEGITVEPSVITCALTDITEPTDATKLPTAKIVTDGDHISIKGYRIAGARLNGNIVSNYGDMFEVSSEGVVSIKGNNPDFLPGAYVLDFKLTTYVVGEEDEEGIFSDALTVNVTSAPKSIVYTPNTGKVEVARAWTFGAPAVTGSLDEIVFSFGALRKMSGGAGTDLTEDEKAFMSIDASTGAISVKEGHTFIDGDEISVDVKAKNKYGEMTASRAFVVNVVTEIKEIADFKYNAVEIVQTQKIVNSPAEGFVGDDAVFTIVSMDEKLEDVLTVDAATGEVTAPRGHEVPIGKYAVTVRAENQKGSAETTFVLNVKENPYYFTYIRYGNNLELEPAADYPNQFRFDYKNDNNDKFYSSVPETDVKGEQPVTFKLSAGAGSFWWRDGSRHTIDEETGVIHFDFRKDIGRYIQIAKVTATVGEGETSVSREALVFIHLSSEYNAGNNKKYRVEFTPFVVRANPVTGNVLDKMSLKVNDADAPETFSMDYRGDQRYANLNGPESHKDGRPKDGNDTFLYDRWKVYYQNIGSALNVEDRSPVSYFTQQSQRSAKLLYLNNNDYQMVVNPRMWQNDEGAANGLFIGQMIFGEVSDKGDPYQLYGSSGTNRFHLCAVWFDEEF